MIKTIWQLLMRVTGGRPMRLERYAFHDAISGRLVCYYVDQFGRRWLAESAWFGMRVPAHFQTPVARSAITQRK